MVKTCSKCGVAKECTDFRKNKPSADGLRAECKKCSSEYERSRYADNVEYYVNRQRQYRKTKEYKEWLNESRDKRNEQTRRRRKENPHIDRWRHLIGSTLRSLGTSKHADTKTLLGYSADELKTHLDNLNMNWDLHHVDHKIPISWFHRDTPPSIVNDLRNLQPLTEKENIGKHNNYADDVDQEYFELVQAYLCRH